MIILAICFIPNHPTFTNSLQCGLRGWKIMWCICHRNPSVSSKSTTYLLLRMFGGIRNVKSGEVHCARRQQAELERCNVLQSAMSICKRNIARPRHLKGFRVAVVLCIRFQLPFSEQKATVPDREHRFAKCRHQLTNLNFHAPHTQATPNCLFSSDNYALTSSPRQIIRP